MVSFVLFFVASVSAAAMITNVSDCTAFVWPPKAAVPSWLNQTSANVLIAPDLHSALLAVVANDTNPVICFTEQNDDLFPVANGLIRYADLNATFESLTLAGFNKSVLIDPTLDFTGLRCVDPNVTCTLTIQDVVVYTDIGMPSLADDSVVTYVGLDLRWTGSVVLDRVRFNPRSFFSWGTGAPNNIKIDGNLTVTDCEFSGIFSFRSGAWMSDTHTAGAVWSISRTKFRSALIDDFFVARVRVCA
jgi:hypothetical protein